MARAIQKRTLETRARLLQAAEDIIADQGYAAMRVEEVVLRAGTAKGTFFAHFKDKDALMELIVGARLAGILDEMADRSAPSTVAEFAEALMPLCNFMTCERYVFDLILRYSGAAAIEEIGPIADTFGRQLEVFTAWLDKSSFRPDLSSELSAEGIQAFMIQAMAAKFCALHGAMSVEERLVIYLQAWLLPKR